jgi:hypothetical protein
VHGAAGINKISDTNDHLIRGNDMWKLRPLFSSIILLLVLQKIFWLQLVVPQATIATLTYWVVRNFLQHYPAVLIPAAVEGAGPDLSNSNYPAGRWNRRRIRPFSSVQARRDVPNVLFAAAAE